MKRKMSKIKQMLVRVYTENLIIETSALKLHFDIDCISVFNFTFSVYHFIAFVLFLSLSLMFLFIGCFTSIIL